MDIETRTTTEYTVICAKCRRRAGWASSEQDARHIAYEAEWTVSTHGGGLGVQSFCPECTAEIFARMDQEEGTDGHRA